MLMIAQRIAEKAGLNWTMEQITETVLSTGEKYHDIMNNEYERTGILISGLIVADFETCHALRETRKCLVYAPFTLIDKRYSQFTNW